MERNLSMDMSVMIQLAQHPFQNMKNLKWNYKTDLIYYFEDAFESFKLDTTNSALAFLFPQTILGFTSDLFLEWENLQYSVLFISQNLSYDVWRMQTRKNLQWTPTFFLTEIWTKIFTIYLFFLFEQFFLTIC